MESPATLPTNITLESSETILGLGIDVIECERVDQSLKRFGDHFLKRIFLPGEINYCQSHKFPARHFAARFAAKEAVSKAFGTGIGASLTWKDMEVTKLASGEPQLQLHGRGVDLAEQRGVRRVLISLTHSDNYAAANAILIGKGQSPSAAKAPR